METKRKLMDSAFRLFAEKGNEFSLSEIAKEANIQKPSIYAHFESKEALLYQVIEREIEAYFFKIEETTDKVNIHIEALESEMKEIFLKILGYYDSREKILFWKRLLLFPPFGFCPTLIERIKTLSELRYAVLGELVNLGIQEGIIRPQSVDAAVLSFFSLIHGSLSSVLIYGVENVDEHYKNLWEIFYKGIKV